MELHGDVWVAFVGFLLLNDELPHSSTTIGSLRGNKERYDPLRSVVLEL
jgi:hypothetical protein